MRNNLRQTKQGVVILFAVLMVSVILTISLGIFNITYRQLVLSSIARESEIAFFAADTARNCALFWDSPARLPSERPFGVYTPDPEGGWLFALTGVNTIRCTEGDVAVSNYNAGAGYSGRTFKLSIPMGDRTACAQVFVKKDYGYSGNRHTEIRANGYNMVGPSNSCPPTNLNRAVERTIVAETQG
jgi:hypothetical protein